MCEGSALFSFGRKAKFEKLLHELKAGVLAQTIGFSAEMADEIDSLVATKVIQFSSKTPTYRRQFSRGQPKTETTHVNQMLLFAGGFSFFWHAIDRYSFRPNNEGLRTAILDPITFALSKGIAEILSNAGIKANAKDTFLGIQSLSLRYAAAPRLLGTNEKDENCALWLAGRAIADDTELPQTDRQRYILAFSIVNKLLEGLVALNLPKRIKALETLL